MYIITYIRIHNIHGHKDTVLNLSRRVNAIIGAPNNGKSSILRAIQWGLTNRPTGTKILRRGTTFGYVQFIIRQKDTNEKHIIVHKIQKGKNIYTVDGNQFEALKGAVPNEVLKYIPISDSNVQSQDDKAFLVSESSGAIGKRIGSIVNLDLIAQLIKQSTKDEREVKEQIGSLEKEIFDLKDELKEYDNLDVLKSWVDRYELAYDKIESIEDKLRYLENCKENITEINLKLSEYKNIDLNLIKHIYRLYDNIKGINKGIERIEYIYSNAKKIKIKLSSVDNSLAQLKTKRNRFINENKVCLLCGSKLSPDGVTAVIKKLME